MHDPMSGSRSTRSAFGSLLCRGGRAVCLAAGLLQVVAACEPSGSNSPNGSGPMALQLHYAPAGEADREALVGVAPLPATVQVWINPVTDARAEPQNIGFSAEGDNTGVVLAEGAQAPAEFVRGVLAKEMPNYGFAIASEAGASTHTLQLKLLKFWVHEGGTYQGEVMVDVALGDNAGQLLWQGTVTGTDKHWGKTFTQENFLNVFSDSTLDLSEKLALRPEIRTALTTGEPQGGQPSAVPAVAETPAADAPPATP